LLFVEVCRNSNYCRRDLLASVIAGGLFQTAQMTGGNLRNGNSRWLAFFLVLNSECDRRVVLLGVGGGMGVGRVYRLETATMVSKGRDRGIIYSYSCPR